MCTDRYGVHKARLRPLVALNTDQFMVLPYAIQIKAPGICTGPLVRILICLINLDKGLFGFMKFIWKKPSDSISFRNSGANLIRILVLRIKKNLDSYYVFGIFFGYLDSYSGNICSGKMHPPPQHAPVLQNNALPPKGAMSHTAPSF